MAKAKAATTHFVVERLNWRRGGGTFYRFPGATRVASFATAAEAETYRRGEEAKARRVVNPFAGTLCPPADQSSLPEHALRDYLQDRGIDPPPGDDWEKWWKKAAKAMTADQRDAAWEALDKVRFFRVEERPKRPVVYAVVEVKWAYNDEWYYPAPEGGDTLTVYRSRAKAEEACATENEGARDGWEIGFDEGAGYEPCGYNQFELNDRVLPGHDPFGPDPEPARRNHEDTEGDGIFTFSTDEVPFFEVVELELEGDL